MFQPGDTTVYCTNCGKEQTLPHLVASVNSVFSDQFPANDSTDPAFHAPHSDKAANKEIATLLRRAYVSLENRQWEQATAYCEMVLDRDLHNTDANLGKLLADLHLCSLDELLEYDDQFDTNKNYQRILQSDDKTLIRILTERNEDIRTRNMKNEVLRLYNRAIWEMNCAQDEESYFEAAKSFDALENFRNAKALANECRFKGHDLEMFRIHKRRRLILFCSAIALTVALVITAVILLFRIVLPSWRYDTAMQLKNDGQYLNAIALFQKLDQYKDSSAQIEECYTAMYGKETYEIIKKLAIGDSYEFGTYEQDNDTANGKEPIEWIVLERSDTHILLLSKYALDCHIMNPPCTEIEWKDTSLCQWLNDQFVKEAFDENAQTKIVSAQNEKKISDPVFLLTLSETKQFLPTVFERQCYPTKYAIAQGAAIDEKTGTCQYWTRTRGDFHNRFTKIESDGRYDEYGLNVETPHLAVRPAIWIDLKTE